MDLQPADPRAQRRALILLIAGLVVGVLLIWGLERYTPALRRWITEDPAAAPARLRTAIAIFALVVVVPPIAFGGYFWWIGVRIRRSGRYPPPGLAMIADTGVLTGDAAIRRAAILQAFGAIIAAVALGAAVVLWRMAALVE